jgi:dihydrolipoamide dehydrogenase
MVTGDLPTETGLLVLGGGPGGYAAAFRAADLGLDVTLVDDGPALGGVWLPRGCIPFKALLELAGLVFGSREAADRGLRFGQPEIDLDEMRVWKADVVERLAGGLPTLRATGRAARRAAGARPRPLRRAGPAGP